VIDPSTLRGVLDAVVVELPAAALPDLIGVLAVTQARAQARLTVPPLPAVGAEDLTAEALAAVFSVPTTQIYEQARQGRIPCLRLGRYVRFNLAAVRQALASAASTESPSLGTRKKRSNGKGVSAPATAVQPRSLTPATPNPAPTPA
jgi:excisionase family DNA binding protein